MWRRKTHRIVDFAEETLESIKFTGEAAGTANILSFTNDGQLMVVRILLKTIKMEYFLFAGVKLSNTGKGHICSWL